MACLTEQQLAALPPATKLLEIGCGPKKLWPHSTTLDVNPKSKADVVHDLNQFPYPFPDDAFDIIVAEHVLEHLDDIIKVVEEIHRISKPGAWVYIEVPHFSSRDFFTDPTHKHAFSTSSFDYFVPAPGGLYNFHYSHVNFRRHKAELSGPDSKWWQRYLNKLAKKNPWRFERELAFIFPREHINFELEVLKDQATIDRMIK